MIGKLAFAESWIVERLKSAFPENKIPHLLGQRLDKMRAAAGAFPAIVNKPAKAAALLDDLAAYVELRAVLAHAHVLVLHDAGGEAYHVFQTACLEAGRPWRARMLISDSELDSLQRRVSDTVNQLRQLTPKPALSPRNQR